VCGGQAWCVLAYLGIPRRMRRAHIEIAHRGTDNRDVRFLPFFSPQQVKSAIEGYVNDLNDDVIRRHGLPHSGGVDRFIIANPKKNESSATPMIQGLIEWKWNAVTMTGVACDMDSVGYRALCDSIYEVTGNFKPFSLTGSLPVIADLQAQGYDVQVTGFGRFDAYHAADEYAKLSEFVDGTKIVTTLIDHLNTHITQ
jgi:acetylornithine deacetylase